MKTSAQRASLCGLAVAAFLISACAGHGEPPSIPAGASAASRGTAGTLGHARRAVSPIQHVVLLIQENRSFDNLFQGYPGANTQNYGMAVPVATCAVTPVPSATAVTVTLAPIPLEASYDIDHDHNNYNWARDDGKMDGFNRECGAVTASPYPQYGYVPQTETKPYWSMAGQYVLADNMFQSNLDGSFIAHQYLIAGQSPNREVDYPNGVWGCVSGPSVTVHQMLPDPNPSHLMGTTKVPVCEDPQTLADELNAAGLTWKFYSVAGPPKQPGTIPSDWNGFGAVNHIYNSPMWTSNMESNPRRILTDVAHGKLANMTWVTPTWTNSDHSAARSKTGPAWIASVVNAIGKSAFWNSTVIFVVWDDWGGWYDHVPPPQLDYDG